MGGRGGAALAPCSARMPKAGGLGSAPRVSLSGQHPVPGVLNTPPGGTLLRDFKGKQTPSLPKGCGDQTDFPPVLRWLLFQVGPKLCTRTSLRVGEAGVTRRELPRVLQWKEHCPEGQESRVWAPALPQTSKSPPRPVSSSIKARPREHEELFRGGTHSSQPEGPLPAPPLEPAVLGDPEVCPEASPGPSATLCQGWGWSPCPGRCQPRGWRVGSRLSTQEKRRG